MNNTRELKLLMVSGAPNKEERFRQQLSQIPNDALLAMRVSKIELRRLDCPVNERNDEPCAPILFDAKARDTHKLMKHALLHDEVGLTVDVHPKMGIPGESLTIPLVKHPNYLSLDDKQERLIVGALYIEQLFGQFGDKELLIRMGAGINPWVYKQGLLGLVNQNNYIHYEKNPLPDKVAARDFLEYAAENHTGVDGMLDNQALERSARSPAFVLQESLLEWAARDRKIKAQVKGRSEEPFVELGCLVDGFTVPMIQSVIEIASSYLHSTADPSTRKEVRIKWLPRRVDSVLWDTKEGHLVTEYVGPYQY